jgi:hypothetical protein
MTKTQYKKKMEAHRRRFDKLWRKMADDTIAYVDSGGTNDKFYELQSVERFTDNLILSGAWIQDRLDGYDYRHRRGLTKKVRKTLGYTYP